MVMGVGFTVWPAAGAIKLVSSREARLGGGAVSRPPNQGVLALGKEDVGGWANAATGTALLA